MSNPYSKYIESGIALYARSQLPERQNLNKDARYFEQLELVSRIQKLEKLHGHTKDKTFRKMKSIRLQNGKDEWVGLFDALDTLKVRNLRTNISNLSKNDIDRAEKALLAEFVSSSLAEIKQGAGSKSLWIFLAYFCEKHETKATNFYKDIGLDYPTDEVPRPKPINPKQYDEPEREWLDPYNQKDIPFVGREAEIDRLHAFAEDDSDFKIWSVVAPSGAGKTRLCYEWAQRPKIKDNWHVLYVGSDSEGQLTFRDSNRRHYQPKGITEAGKWDDWNPEMPTIFIIDYISGYKKTIETIIKRCFRSQSHISGALPHHVRLLILEHTFHDELGEPQSNVRCRVFGRDSKSNTLASQLLFNDKPLILTETTDQNKIIQDIIQITSGLDVKIDADRIILDRAKEYLENMSGAWHPLFAALIGDAIKRDQRIDKWNRHDLIRYHLSGNDRLPWGEGELDHIGMWAACFIATATSRGGVKERDLLNCEYATSINIPIDFEPILEICASVIPKNDQSVLLPFKPDILGENFFLLLIEKLQKTPIFGTTFYALLECGNQPEQTKGAWEFASFITRLMNNLLNEDQSISDTKHHWHNLFAILDPKYYTEGSPLRWEVSFLLIKFAESHAYSVFDRLGISQIEIINKVSENDVYENIPEALLSVSAEAAILLYNFKTSLVGFSSETKLSFLKFIDLYNESDPEFPPLNLVAALGFIDIFEEVLARGCDLNQKTVQGFTPLIYACGLHEQDMALHILENYENVDLNEINDFGVSALMAALYALQKQSAAVLIEKGADLTTVDLDGYTPLLLACILGFEDLAISIIKKGVDLNVQTKDSKTALMIASEQGLERVASAILERESNLNHQDIFGRTALYIACYEYNETIALSIISQNLDLNLRCECGDTALMRACNNELEDVAVGIIKKEPDFTKRDKSGWTALMHVCGFDLKDAAKEMINKNHDTDILIDEQNDFGTTALMFACESDCGEIALALIAKNPDFELKDNEDRTALMLACGYVDDSIALSLLNCNIKLNEQDNHGMTALMIACHHEREVVSLALIEKGADLNIQNVHESTALIFASSRGLDKVVSNLLDENVDINHSTDLGYSALHAAVEHNHFETVKLLVDNQANLDMIYNFFGHKRSALDIALEEGYAEIVQHLRNFGQKV